MRYIAFHLGEGRYVFPLHGVEEVLPLLPMRKVVQAPGYISGLINYRGQLVPVVDLCQLALEKPCQHLLSTRLLLLKNRYQQKKKRLFAVMVERAVSVVDIDPDSFKPQPVKAGEATYLGGLAPMANEMVQLLKLNEVLNDNVVDLLSGDNGVD